MTREELNDDKHKEVDSLEKKEKRKKIFFRLLKWLIYITIFSTAFYFYNDYIATGTFIVKENRIINSKIPDSFNGVKIIHFSDLHYGTAINEERLEKIVKEMNKRKPDIVIFTGDLIAKGVQLDSKKQEKMISLLKSINASLGKYAIVGDEDGDNYSTIINQSDFTVLNNEYDFVYNKNNEAIMICGFASMLRDSISIENGLSYFDTENANTNIYTIAAFHEPDATDKILTYHKVDLLLAGHSHNGYIRIPYVGTIINIKGSNTYNQEFYDIDNSLLYISSGLGTEGDGIRIFSKPSFNFFRLSNS